MTEIWQSTFADHQLLWGREPTRCAEHAADLFAASGAKTVLIPGVGYGRNARSFLARGMSVTGIEIAETAIALARSALALDIVIHHGSVEQMPFDSQIYDGIFCYGLLYLLDAPARQKLITDCQRQLAPGGQMVFSVLSKRAPQYGRGERLGEDWYQTHPGIQLYFYDAESIGRDFGGCGEIAIDEVDEPQPNGSTLPFLNVLCRSTVP